MGKLKNVTTDVPGGWYFKVDATEHLVRAGNYWKLVKEVKNHLRLNDIEIPESIEDIIQDAICQRIPSDFCIGGGPSMPIASLAEFVETTRAICNAHRSSKHFPVSTSVAIQRVPTCVSCQHNKSNFGCWGCEEPAKLSRSLYRLPKQNFLKGCNILKAANRAIVHCDERLLRQMFSKLEDALPDNCWVKPLLKEQEDGDVQQH